MWAAPQTALLAASLQYTLPGFDGLRRIDVVIDRDHRTAELRLRRMDDIAPDQKAFFPAFDHVAVHAGRVPVLADAGTGASDAFSVPARTLGCPGPVRLPERRSTFRRRFRLRVAIQPRCRIRLVDHDMGKDVLAADAEAAGMIGMDMDE